MGIAGLAITSLTELEYERLDCSHFFTVLHTAKTKLSRSQAVTEEETITILVLIIIIHNILRGGLQALNVVFRRVL